MTRITRRHFFRGMSFGASGTFLLPFLERLEASPSGAKQPLRFLFFLQGNGLIPRQVWPGEETMEREPGLLLDRPLSDLAFPDALQPLESFRKKMTLIHGLSGRVCGPPSHSADFGALGCFPTRLGVHGETIDSALARLNPSIFPHVGLGVMGKDSTVVYNVSAAGPGRALPTQCQPGAAYRRLFASAAGGSARSAFEARTDVLDFLADDVKRLRTRLDGIENEKLDRYLGAFEEMGTRQAALAQASARIKRHAPGHPEGFPTGAGGFDHLEAQLSIATGALAAGLTKVVTVSSGSGRQFSDIEVDGRDLGLGEGPIGLHAIGHGKSYFGKSSEEIHGAIRRKHLELLAATLKQLASIPEGDGSMLDNTLVVYTSDHGEGHHPGCKEWPFVLIGDLGGRLKAGNRLLRYPWYGKPGHRTTANLYTTFLHVAGQPCERFGLADLDLRDLDQSGPLSELMT